jgi:hypothetical protein
VIVLLSGKHASAATTQVTSISPASVKSGSSAFTLSVQGKNFTQHSVVLWNGTSLTTTCVSATMLHASISAADVSLAGQVEVSVRTTNTWSGRNSSTSNSVPFVITSATTPVVPLQVTTATLPGGTVGTSYSAALNATGGTAPYTWSVVSGSLSAGLIFSTGGSISGTPTSAGQSTFTLQAKDSAASPQAATVSFTITVSAPAAAHVAITCASLPTATASTAFSTTLTASGGTQPYTWTLASGQLPSGMSLSAAGVISGTTSVTGTFPFTAEVTDETSISATASLDLIVAAKSTTPGYTVWYAPISFWNTPIAANAAIDPNSAGMISYAIASYANGANLANTTGWGMSYVYSTASSKTYNVACTEYCTSSSISFPIPAGTLANTGSDHHLAVINTTTNTELDMWQASYNSSSDTWSASSIVTTSITGWGAVCALGQLCNGEVAAGFAMLGGSVRPEEIKAGVIPHALSIMTPATKSGYIACPATHTDGQSSNANSIPEGARIQLNPSFNVAAQNWTAWQKTIAVALQTYGAYISDTGGSLAMYAVNDMNSGNTTWASVGMTNAGESLSFLPWSEFQVIQLTQCGN